jgi:hypothetical protein
LKINKAATNGIYFLFILKAYQKSSQTITYNYIKLRIYPLIILVIGTLDITLDKMIWVRVSP